MGNRKILRTINKYISFSLVVAFLTTNIFLARAEESGYRISVTIKGFKDNVCYLGYPYGDKKYIQDTAKNETGETFIFEGSEALTGGVYFIYNPNNVYFDLIVSDQHFSLTTDTLDFVGHMHVEGSAENTMFNDFQKFMREKQTAAKKLSDQLKSNPDHPDAENIKEQLKVMDQEVKDYRLELIQNNPETLVAKFINSTVDIEVPESPKNDAGEEIDPNFKYKYYKEHYFDHIDFSDERMLRTPTFHSKMMDYLEKLTVKHPDSIIHSAHIIIDKSKANKDVFRYCVVTITNHYETSNIMGMDRVFVDLAENYYLTGDAFWADDELMDKIEKRVKELKPNLLGNDAPSIALVDTTLKPFSLKTINSDYVVIYFYDPDCGHCKKKTPELRDLYNSTLKAQGIEVLGACITTDADKWKKYIRDQKLNWINGADLFLKSNFRAEYNIATTPQIYIVDKENKIIAKKLDVEQIEDFIKRHKALSEAQKSG